MTQRIRGLFMLTAMALLTGAASVALTSGSGHDSGEAASVTVTNFPLTQRVEGSVRLDGPLPLTTTRSFRHIEVPPRLSPTSARATAAGTIETDGFGSIALSLSAAQAGQINRPGEVGVLLLPDEESILEIFETRGIPQFALELKAECAVGATVCVSEPSRLAVAFPRYKAYLYNTTERMARVDLYAYLTQ